MTDTLTRPGQVEDDAADAAGERAAAITSGRWAGLRRYAGRPVFLATVLILLYAYISGLELDSIEARTLTADFIVPRITRHVYLTVVSTVIVLLIAVPLGIIATRPRFKPLQGLILALGNIGQALPSLGLITLLILWLGVGVRPVIIGLVAYSALPILRNTMVGIQQVDTNLIEAGRGMGMSESLVLRKIEMPLAVPVILAGVRTALVINVGTATLAYLFNGGALGEVIFRGFQLQRDSVLLVGAVLTAALALLIDYLAGLAEEVLRPRGL
jgi:osmoprotectant transport system permease protein